MHCAQYICVSTKTRRWRAHFESSTKCTAGWFSGRKRLWIANKNRFGGEDFYRFALTQFATPTDSTLIFMNETFANSMYLDVLARVTQIRILWPKLNYLWCRMSFIATNSTSRDTEKWKNKLTDWSICHPSCCDHYLITFNFLGKLSPNEILKRFLYINFIALEHLFHEVEYRLLFVECCRCNCINKAQCLLQSFYILILIMKPLNQFYFCNENSPICLST